MKQLQYNMIVVISILLLMTLSGVNAQSLPSPTTLAVAWSPDGSQLIYGDETPDGQTEILKIIQFPVANTGPDQAITDSVQTPPARRQPQ